MKLYGFSLPMVWISCLQVRVPVCNIDLAYTEEQWGELKDTSGDGHVSTWSGALGDKGGTAGVQKLCIHKSFRRP
jgi:hypothetical protein